MIKIEIVKGIIQPNIGEFMRASFHPKLINDPFSDPVLFIPFLFEKRALLFDLGDINSIASKELLKLTQVFVSHMHMDHFIGFDSLLRIFLGREKTVHFFGPPGFFKCVEGKLAGYTWNLVEEYQNDLIFKVTEVHQEMLRTKEYRCQDKFLPEKIEEKSFSWYWIIRFLSRFHCSQDF